MDLTAFPDPEQQAQADAIQESQTPLDLKNGPLVRTKLLRMGPADHVLLVTTHHIAFDGWSRRILVSELAALYDAFCAGLPSSLPELPLQYADYAVWQRNYLQGDNLGKLWTTGSSNWPTHLRRWTCPPTGHVLRCKASVGQRGHSFSPKPSLQT